MTLSLDPMIDDNPRYSTHCRNIHYTRKSASEKRRNALKSFVSKFRRNSLSQKISLIQHTRGFSNVILGNTEKSCSCLYFLIIDLFIVLDFLCVIEFSQIICAEKSKRFAFVTKVARDKKRKM